MKNLLLIAAIVGITFFSVACLRSEKLKGNEFLIEGELSDVEDGVVIMLFRTNDNNSITGSSLIATDTVKNGRFLFKGEAVLNPDWLTIYSGSEGFPSTMTLTIWAAPKANIKITGKGKMLPLWDVKSSVPYQKEENIYKDKNLDFFAEQVRLSTERSNVFTKINAATSEEESLAYQNIANSLLAQIESLIEKQYFNEIGIMEQTKVTGVWINKMFQIANVLFASSTSSYVRLEQADELRKKAEVLYNKMSEEDKSTPMGQLITVKLFPPSIVGVGDDMADADLLDEDENTKHISDYLDSNKYLLLDFWFRGCGYCIMALPEMREISETYLEKLTIISISIDNDDNWKKALTEHDMPWVNIRDLKNWGGLAANYGVVMAPNYVLISPEGKVADKWAGYGTGYLKQKVGENIK